MDSVDKMRDALRSGNIEEARSLLEQHSNLMAEGGRWLYDAAERRNLPMVQMLIGVGIGADDPNYDASTPLSAAAKIGDLSIARYLLEQGANVNYLGRGLGCPLDAAATYGHFKMVQFLLEQGATVNIGGGEYCTPLAAAATFGHLDIVRMLLERGADPHVLYGTMEFGDPPRNALFQAVAFGHHEIAAMLREHGATMPPGSEEIWPESVLGHVEKHLGKPDELALHQVVPGVPPITVHTVQLDWCVALVTDGMSARPMTVPDGVDEYRFAELVIYLPKDWPLGKEALRDLNNFWPIEWLLRIGHYPHDNDTWLGGSATVISNDEPPLPLAENTKQSCLLAITEESEFGCFQLNNGRIVNFYTLFPLYTEERDLEKQHGIAHILELFEKHRIGRAVDLARPNVVH